MKYLLESMGLYFQMLTHYLKITRGFVSQTIVCHYFVILSSFLTVAEMGFHFQHSKDHDEDIHFLPLPFLK